MSSVYDVGDMVRIQTDPVFSIEGVATDPTAVTLKVKVPPDGTVEEFTYADLELTRAAAGDYYRNITLTAPGVWAWEFIGTGTVVAGASGTFRVRTSAIE